MQAIINGKLLLLSKWEVGSIIIKTGHLLK